MKNYIKLFSILLLMDYVVGLIIECEFDISLWDKSLRMGIMLTTVAVFLFGILAYDITTDSPKLRK